MNKPEISREEFEKFRDYIVSTSGIYFDDNKLTSLQMGLRDRMNTLSIFTFRDYFRYISSPENEAEYRRLLEVITINETSFFRNLEHFKALRSVVFPEILKRNDAIRRIRVWSAGCSTGEEAYSITIALLDMLGSQHNWNIEVFATDISERVIKHGERGRYRAEALKSLPKAVINKYFIPVPAEEGAAPNVGPSPREYDVHPDLRKLVHFGYFNLVKDSSPFNDFADMDIIFCENVTIYFQFDIVKKVIDNFYNVLNPGGYLFIGYSETLWKITNKFDLISLPNTFFYRRGKGPTDDGKTRVLSYGTIANNGGSDEPETHVQTRTSHILMTTSPALPGSETKPEHSIPRRRQTGMLRRPPTASLAPHPPALQTASHVANERIKEAKTLLTNERKTSEDDFSQGLRLLHDGDYDQAEHHLERALRWRPRSPEIHTALGQIYANKGQYDKAVNFCQKAIAFDTLAEEAHLLLGMVYTKQNRIDKAVEEFKKTIYINFESPLAHLRLAEIFRDNGNNAEALREYKCALWALEKRPPTEIVAGLPAELLKRACKSSIETLKKVI